MNPISFLVPEQTIKALRLFVNPNEIRPVCASINFDGGDFGLFAIATNGSAMLAIQVSKEPMEPLKRSVPAKAIDTLLSLEEKSSLSSITFVFSDAKVSMRHASSAITIESACSDFTTNWRHSFQNLSRKAQPFYGEKTRVNPLYLHRASEAKKILCGVVEPNFWLCAKERVEDGEPVLNEVVYSQLSDDVAIIIAPYYDKATICNFSFLDKSVFAKPAEEKLSGASQATAGVASSESSESGGV